MTDTKATAVAHRRGDYWRYMTVATAQQAVDDAVAANDKAIEDYHAAHEAMIATGCAPYRSRLAESLAGVSDLCKAELRRARLDLEITRLRVGEHVHAHKG